MNMTPNPKKKYGWLSVIYDLAGDIKNVAIVEDIEISRILSYINYINDVRISEKSVSK